MGFTRRNFLTGCAAIGGVMGAATAAPTETKIQNSWKLGLGLNGFMSSAQDYKKEYPLWEVLDFAEQEGFDGIELVEGWPQGPYPAHDDAEAIRKLKGLYNRYNLQIYTTQNGGDAAHSASANIRKDWLKDFRKRIELCKALGCDFIGHWPGGGMGDNKDIHEAIKNLAESYRSAAAICADSGLYMSFEIEPPFIFNTLEHLQEILSQTNHPACKTNYDPSHFDLMWGSTGKPHEMLAKVGMQNIGHVHLTDTDGTIFNGTSKHLACGDGHCDMPASFKTLWEGGYRGWMMIDGWKIEDVYDAARKGNKAISDFLMTVQK